MTDESTRRARDDAPAGEGATYTRSPMDSGAVASRSDLPTGAQPGEGAGSSGLDTDAPGAMALLAAREDERSRLAEELHDGPAQALSNAIFQIQIVDRALRAEPDTAPSELAALREMLERELDTLRGYINQLRPSLNEAAELDDALREAAAAFTQRTGVPVEVTFSASGDGLHQAAQTVVLRVAQEALRNIAKHANASRVWLTTAEVPSAAGNPEWTLEVGDDGRGFDYDGVTTHPDKRHFGLRFMRERAELLGSRLQVHSDPQAGTVVRLAFTREE